jgi:2-methylcitrate dehydratase PrpD
MHGGQTASTGGDGQTRRGVLAAGERTLRSEPRHGSGQITAGIAAASEMNLRVGEGICLRRDQFTIDALQETGTR